MNDTKEQLDIQAPPGYSQLQPFNRETFRGLGRRRNAPAEFARGLNSIYITALEFFQAARHYPIVFGRDSQTGSYVPVAITGLENEQNLFVDSAGEWLEGTYVPAYVRRWPFFVVQVRDQPEKSLVCVDPVGLEENDQPLVDATGEPTAQWTETERLLQEMENARQQTIDFTRALAELDLIEPFEAHAMAKGGGNARLAGMFRVSENRLNKLPDRNIRQLMKKGQLSRIYAHLISLEGFQRLLDLRHRRSRQGDS